MEKGEERNGKWDVMTNGIWDNWFVQAGVDMSLMNPYGCDFSKCNVYYLEAPNETHWWGIVRHYVRTGLPLFFHEHQDD